MQMVGIAISSPETTRALGLRGRHGVVHSNLSQVRHQVDIEGNRHLPLQPQGWCILRPRDSGSIVVEGLGRILCLLTVNYLTPYYWVEERIKQAFPNSCLHPIVV
jgi:hypothetical protein